MGFSSVFLFCTKKKSHGLYGEKRKFRPYIGTKLQFFSLFFLPQTFFTYIVKNQWNFYPR